MKKIYMFYILALISSIIIANEIMIITSAADEESSSLTNETISAQFQTPFHRGVSEEWRTTFGGCGNFGYLYQIQQTLDGGYILAGHTNCRSIFPYNFNGDAWLIKTDSEGRQIWSRALGGVRVETAYSVQPTSDGGYILAGKTAKYGDSYNDAWLIKTDSDGHEAWSVTFGGLRNDEANSVHQTSDGGYIMAGKTYSFGSGLSDAWLIKTDSNGREDWNVTFGGEYYDAALSVQPTSDGGYILTGVKNKYSAGAGESDAWLIKTDSNGREVWNVTFDGAREDHANSVQLTSDGGYILAGRMYSSETNYDAWLIKTDSEGRQIWSRIFNSDWNGDDTAISAQQTSDGGYILAATWCWSCSALAEHGRLIKTDSDGNEIWNTTFGGLNVIQSVLPTSDGGYILVGRSPLNETDGMYALLIKTNSEGCQVWTSTFGGADDDWAYSMQPTSDGGYILAGYTHSFGAGDADAWLIKTDSCGREAWNTTFGGADYDDAVSVQPTFDAGYVLAGETSSIGAGGSYAWLIKTDSAGREVWNTTFGEEDEDSINSVQPMLDGGYILAGRTRTYGAGGSDAWLVKTDSVGREVWNTTFGGESDDSAESIKLTSDGGYILAGNTESFGAGVYNGWLIKTDSAGSEVWNTTFGGGTNVEVYSVQPTSDGGYIMAGDRASDSGFIDAWLIKTDSVGREVWNTTFGGLDIESAKSVRQTSDGGYIIGGTTESIFGFGINAWLIKTDSSGREMWNFTFGNTSIESSDSVYPTSDGAYVLAGTMFNEVSNSSDAWLSRVRPDR